MENGITSLASEDEHQRDHRIAAGTAIAGAYGQRDGVGCKRRLEEDGEGESASEDGMHWGF
jgi:hypothetical protein